MMTVKLGFEVIPLLTKLQDVLKDVPDPIIQQQAIELLLIWHARRMPNTLDSLTVVDGIAKHVKQMITGNVDMIVEGDRRR
jgi:hypothetical protein